MTPARAANRTSLLPALLLVCAGLLIAIAFYAQLYARSATDLVQVRETYERVAWISSAEPKWRTQFAALHNTLERAPPFLRADRPQEAAADIQSRIRQAVMGAGATVDSLQSTVATPANDQLPAIRAVIVARSAPAQIMDVVRSLEAIDPPLGFESLDITAQQVGGKEAPERRVTLTIAVRTYVLGARNDGG